MFGFVFTDPYATFQNTYSRSDACRQNGLAFGNLFGYSSGQNGLPTNWTESYWVTMGCGILELDSVGKHYMRGWIPNQAD
jgi:hypothetical protein